MIPIALAPFVKFAQFVSRIQDKHVVYTELKRDKNLIYYLHRAMTFYDGGNCLAEVGLELLTQAQ